MRRRDFFAAQRFRQKTSALFFGLFAAAVAFFVLLLFVVCLALGAFFGKAVLAYWAFALLCFGLYVAVGLLVGQQKTRFGGAHLAKKAGAVRLFVASPSDDPSDRASDESSQAVYFPHFIRVYDPKDLPDGYRRLYAFVEQMRLAAGLFMPMVYVMPDQDGINAWTVGFDRADTAMVFTQGAVDKLSDDALYALVGHEFGHILRGDNRLNLRMYAWTTALSWFYEAADWLEGWIFGAFDSDYHNKAFGRVALPASGANSKEGWIAYWADKRAASDDDRSAKAHELFWFLPTAAFLLLWRLLGVAGMAAHAWIARRFCRERDFLADATAAQLTRSFGVVELLKAVQQHGGATQSPYSAHDGYFFFADPSQNDAALARKNIAYRIDAIADAFLVDLQDILPPKSALDAAYAAAMEGAQTRPKTDAPKPPVADALFGVAATSGIATASGIAAASGIATASDGYQSLADLDDRSAASWPWEIVQRRKNVQGALLCIEAALLCRFAVVGEQKRVDFFDIFVKLDYNEKNPIACPSDDVFWRPVKTPLLKAQASLDRRFDGVAVAKGAQAVQWHINNPNIPLSPEDRDFLRRYGLALRAAVLRHSGHFLPPSQDARRFFAGMDALRQACAGALVRTALSDFAPSLPSPAQAIAAYADNGADVDAETFFGLLLLVFALSLQNSDWLLQKRQDVEDNARRLLRLAQIEPPPSLDLLACIQNSHALAWGDWVLVLLFLQKRPLPIKRRLRETLHTVFLGDGKLRQKEADILRWLDALWLPIPQKRRS